MPSYGDTTWPQAKAHYESILLLSKMLLATLEGRLISTTEYSMLKESFYGEALREKSKNGEKGGGNYYASKLVMDVQGKVVRAVVVHGDTS